MTEQLTILKDVFEPELLQEIRQKAKYLKLKEGEVMLDIGQPVLYVPIVLKGSLKVSRNNENGNELLLYYVGGNESCAMTFTCCMMRHASEVRAVAEEEAEGILIPIELMDEWMSKYPTWKSFVMRTIRMRFNELLRTIDGIAFHKLDERLVTYLKEKSKASGSALINLTHQQIADELATSRVVVSRLLKQLENQKKLLLYRNQIKLLSDM
jgi:CRP/FNR family transcriptional regulator